MKKKRLIMLFLQLVLVVAFSAFFYTYVDKEVEPTEVYVYSQDLNVKDEVSVGVVEIPAKAIQEGMLVVGDEDDEKLLEKNKFVNVKVSKEQFVYEKQLSKEGDIDPFETMDLEKYRKVSLPISYVEGFGGDIQRGDTVDLIFTGAGKKSDEQNESEFQYSKAFLQDVLVYNVTTADGYRFDGHSEKALGETPEGTEGEEVQVSANAEELAVITLAVTLDQAEEIQARKSIGVISFASRFEDNKSYETLGFVIGEYDKVFSAPANAETGRATINSGQ